MAEEGNAFHDKLEERAFTLLRKMAKDAQDKIDQEDPVISISTMDGMVNLRRSIAIEVMRVAYLNLKDQQK